MGSLPPLIRHTQRLPLHLQVATIKSLRRNVWKLTKIGICVKMEVLGGYINARKRVTLVSKNRLLLTLVLVCGSILHQTFHCCEDLCNDKTKGFNSVHVPYESDCFGQVTSNGKHRSGIFQTQNQFELLKVFYTREIS